MLIGGFVSRHGAAMSDDEIRWFEAFIEEQDVDIMAWAIGTQATPERWAGPMMQRLQALDYIETKA